MMVGQKARDFERMFSNADDQRLKGPQNDDSYRMTFQTVFGTSIKVETNRKSRCELIEPPVD